MRIKKPILLVLTVTVAATLGVGLFYLWKRKAPPSEPTPTKTILLWENGEKESVADEDSPLGKLLLQTLHRLNLQAKYVFDDEKIQELKEGAKLIELIFSDPEDIKISQQVESEERSHIPTDEDGYQILKSVKTAVFVLEDKSANGTQANILISSEGEEKWGCWAIQEEEGNELDKTWVDEIEALLRQKEEVEKPQEPKIFLVVEVIDGDTIKIETGQKVRYIGVDAPETKECFGVEALAKNKELVVGKEVKLYQDISEKDKAGRLLRYVWVNDTFVNDLLVRQGYATGAPQPPNIKYDEQLLGAEQEAKENNRGLWQACQPISLSPAKTTGDMVVDPDCSQFNAPGDDNFNKEKEYVCFTNKDTATINMEGWTVEDGWYGWTYTFPSFTLKTGKSVKVHTGCGKDSFTDLYWCKPGYEVWHNEGDTVYLRDSSRTIIDAYTYKEQ